VSDREFHERVGTAVQASYRGESGRINPVLDKPAPGSPAATGGLDAGCSRWATRGEVFYGVGETHAELPAGAYHCFWQDGIGSALLKLRIETDTLMELPDDAGASIIAEFATFWQIRDRFRERGFLHKRGFLLWGPPGSGKTSTLQLLIKRLVTDMGGVVLILDQPSIAAGCLQLARKIEPDRPMIAVMEDIDALVQKFGESEYLSLLDGEAQVDRIVFLATTNYPERLDKRFVDRPSRFDTVRWIGMPSAAARRMYLTTKEPSLGADELAEWVERSDGFSVAHLKELIIAVKCFGQPLDAVIERLEAQRQRPPSSEEAPDRKGAGFLGGLPLTNGHAG
jgi:hypothetical protein